MAAVYRPPPERVTLQTVDKRVSLVEYKVDRIYWAVNGILAIIATGIFGAAVTWMINGGLVHFPVRAGEAPPALVLRETDR